MQPMIDLLPHFPERWLPNEKCGGVDWAAAGVKRKFYLLMTGRSGSRHLVDLMSQTNVLGWPGEYFNERHFDATSQAQNSTSFGDYLHRIAGETQRGGTFGFKIDIWRLRSLMQLVDFPVCFPPSETALLTMTRQALLPQAYSFAVARATGAWHDFKDAGTKREYEPSDHELWYELFLLAAAETEIEAHIRRSGRKALRFTYEELIADRQRMIEQICRHVGVEWNGKLTGQQDAATTVQKISYTGRERRLDTFRTRFADQFAELDRTRTAFDRVEFAQRLDDDFGLGLTPRPSADGGRVAKLLVTEKTGANRGQESGTRKESMRKPEKAGFSGSSGRKLFVHIGMHKTGTTSIQAALHSLSDQLFIRDYLYPMAARHPREFRSHALLPHLLGVPVPEGGPMHLSAPIERDAHLRTLRNEVDMSGREKVILSSEDLWTTSTDGIKNLKEVFHDFDIVPILFVRHPAWFAQSLYQTMIRYGHLKADEIAQKKNFWTWLSNVNLSDVVDRWAAIAKDKRVVVVDYDKAEGKSGHIFFQAVGLPLNIPGFEALRAENSSEPSVFTFLRQELLQSGQSAETIEALLFQLSAVPMTEKQTLIPDADYARLNTSYLAQCKKLRASSKVRLIQSDAFEAKAPAAAPVHIGTMSGVVFALGRALARLPK